MFEGRHNNRPEVTVKRGQRVEFTERGFDPIRRQHVEPGTTGKLDWIDEDGRARVRVNSWTTAYVDVDGIQPQPIRVGDTVVEWEEGRDGEVVAIFGDRVVIESREFYESFEVALEHVEHTQIRACFSCETEKPEQCGEVCRTGNAPPTSDWICDECLEH